MHACMKVISIFNVYDLNLLEHINCDHLFTIQCFTKRNFDVCDDNCCSKQINNLQDWFDKL